MASSAFTVRQAVVVLLVTLISHTSSHRLSGHPFLKNKNNVTLSSSTTSQTTEKVVIDDKVPGPSVKFPSAGQSFLDYLMNRGSYFDKAGSGSQSSTVSSDIHSTPQTEWTSTQASDATSKLPEPTTDTTATTTASTTTASTTFSTSTTSRNNPVGTDAVTVNQNRPDQLPFNNDPQAQNRDRLNRYQLADLWLQRFRRPSILDPVHSRFRSGDVDSGNKTASNQSSSNNNQNQGLVEIDRNGGVYILYGRPTQPPTTTTTLPVGDKQGATSSTPLDIQDKPYYGSSLGVYFDNDRITESTVNASNENETSDDELKERSRRAADVVRNGSSCADSQHFQPCQFYPQCFHAVSETCSTRDSFLGDVFNRFCSKTMETLKSVRSELLVSYLRSVELCTRAELAKIVEYPSCSEVTSAVQDALIIKTHTSCLYQRETFCNVLDDAVARPSLARMFNSTSDVQFMFRVMVNLGNIASYCRSQGASIFVTDITMLATAADSPYKDLVGNTPIPGIVSKI